MNDYTGTQTQQYSGWDDEIGAGEARPNNKIFVNLRCGDIAQTSNKQIEDDWTPEMNVNNSGTEYHFFAKKYPHLTGHVVDIYWHKHTLKDGTELSSWNIVIDTKQPKLFVLGVGTNDPNYSRLMATLPGVDFERSVRFVGFKGENKRTHKPQKMLLLSQQKGPDDKPIWLQPKTEAKWLSRVIIDKLKNGDELFADEEKNVARNADGSFNKEYPYIVQKPDGKWSFDTWESFLFEGMKEFVIPNVQAACEARGYKEPSRGDQEAQPDIPADVANAPAPVYNDDIPF